MPTPNVQQGNNDSVTNPFTTVMGFGGPLINKDAIANAKLAADNAKLLEEYNKLKDEVSLSNQAQPEQEDGWWTTFCKWLGRTPSKVGGHVENTTSDFYHNNLRGLPATIGEGFTTRGNWFYDKVFDHPDFSVKQFGIKTGDFVSQQWNALFGKDQPQPPAEPATTEINSSTPAAEEAEETGLTADLNTSNTIPNEPINLEREPIDIPLPKKPEDDILTSKALDMSAKESVEKTLKDFRPTIPGFDPK